MKRVIMTGLLSAMVLAGISYAPMLAKAKPVSYNLPEETAAFKPGPTWKSSRITAPHVIQPTTSRLSLKAPSSRKISGTPRS